MKKIMKTKEIIMTKTPKATYDESGGEIKYYLVEIDKEISELLEITNKTLLEVSIRKILQVEE